MLLTTDRLILREFTAGDWTAVLAYQSDPLYLRYNPWTERTPEEVQQFVNRFVLQQQEEPRLKFQLAVTPKETGELIGSCGIRKGAAGSHEADIGYELDPRFWGRGYATEAAGALLEFGFTQLGLHRITAWCIAENSGSARVLEKIGMRQEGRLREVEHYKGQWWDTLIFAILDREWQAGLAACE